MGNKGFSRYTLSPKDLGLKWRLALAAAAHMRQGCSGLRD